MLHAAITYAERGWPVLPGSVFDGRRYVTASTRRPTHGLRPALPCDQASTDTSTVAQWWRVHTPLMPSVLLRTGQAFDAVSVSREVAIEMVQTSAFRDAPGPVILRLDQGRAYFLVGPRKTAQSPGGAQTCAVHPAAPTVIEPVPSGGWLAAPPTRTSVGAVTWLAAPQATGWEPITASVLTRALRAVAPAPHQPDGGDQVGVRGVGHG